MLQPWVQSSFRVRLEPGCRVAAGVNLLQLFAAHLGVDGRRVELLVAEQLRMKRELVSLVDRKDE